MFRSIVPWCVAVVVMASASGVQAQSTSPSESGEGRRERGRDSQPGGGGRDGGRGREGGRGLLSEANTFKTDVPSHPFNIILVRPTSTSITASVASNVGAVGYVEWAVVPEGQTPGSVKDFPARTPERAMVAGEPASFELDGLKADTRYAYRWRSRAAGESGGTFETGPVSSFITPQAPGDASSRPRDFSFTIIADSHLDPAMTPAVYEQALRNALADGPAFHMDLGDTFMTDKRGRNFRESWSQYVAQRYYFGILCHAAPLFMVLGNHDGEAGYAARGEGNVASWSYDNRTKLFPPPEIGAGPQAMYTGRTSLEDGRGGMYYEFTWGDAQIIVLDPFWFTTERPRGGGGGGSAARGGTPDADVVNTDDNWARTLGKAQYDWLARTLETSKAKYTFVFIHHLVGGLGRANRGGVESSVFFEWGGRNADGSPGFAERRPGWAMPIHDLLAKHHVSAVFHGHDHLYVRSERDGVVYQCVPQPGNLRGNTRSAETYGYKSGTILGSPGHLRVQVAADKATVAFIRSALPEQQGEDRGRGNRGRQEGAGQANGAVVHAYDILPSNGAPRGGKETRP